MSPDEFREAGEMLATYLRPIQEVSPELGKAMLLWLDDPTGLPFEAFLGISRECDQPHQISFRDQLCRQYAAVLPEMSISSAANLIIDRVLDCDNGIGNADEFGPLFVVFYKQLKALNFEIPEHRTLRRIIGRRIVGQGMANF